MESANITAALFSIYGEKTVHRYYCGIFVHLRKTFNLYLDKWEMIQLIVKTFAGAVVVWWLRKRTPK